MDFGENEAPKGTDPVSAGAAPAEQYTSVASSSARSGVPTEELAIRARAIAQRRAIEEYDQKARLQKTPSPRAPAAKKAAPKPETEWVPGHQGCRAGTATSSTGGTSSKVRPGAKGDPDGHKARQAQQAQVACEVGAPHQRGRRLHNFEEFTLARAGTRLP